MGFFHKLEYNLVAEVDCLELILYQEDVHERIDTLLVVLFQKQLAHF